MQVTNGSEFELTNTDKSVAGFAVAVVAVGTTVGLTTKTNVGAILAFIAAIFVALLTAYWTQRRLGQELNAAKSRLAAQLAAETYRHTALLRHERQRDDLSAAREVLDDAARALNEADRAQRDIYDDLGNNEKVESLKQAGRKLDEVKQRMAIRFGSDHEITSDLSTCVELTLQVFGATAHWKLDDQKYARQQAEQGMNEFGPAWENFIAAATRHAGIDLPKQAVTESPMH